MAIFVVIAGLVALLGAVGGLVLLKRQPLPEPPKPVKFTVQNVPEIKIEAPASEPESVIVLADPAPSSAETDLADASPEIPGEEAIPSSTAPAGTAAWDNPEAEIKAFLASWGKAWEASAGQSGRIDPYTAHFSEKFRDGSMDLAAWRADKAAKNRRKEWIRIGIGNVRISGPAADGTVRVKFLQTYESSNYSDKTEKTLVLSREGGRWKISSFGGQPTPR